MSASGIAERGIRALLGRREGVGRKAGIVLRGARSHKSRGMGGGGGGGGGGGEGGRGGVLGNNLILY